MFQVVLCDGALTNASNSCAVLSSVLAKRWSSACTFEFMACNCAKMSAMDFVICSRNFSSRAAASDRTSPDATGSCASDAAWAPVVATSECVEG